MPTHLTIVAWNCARKFRDKAEFVSRLEPDVAVISEVDESELSRLNGASFQYLPSLRSGGVIVLGYHGWTIEKTDIRIDDELFLPVVARRGDAKVQIVGACVKRDDLKSYVRPTLRALEHLEEFIEAAPTIIAGDFNQSAAFKRNPPFSDVIQRLTGFGLRSAWHEVNCRDFGSEGSGTFFQHFNAQNPSHIDYIFVPPSAQINAASLGSFDEFVASRISDHAPLIVSIAFGQNS